MAPEQKKTILMIEDEPALQEAVKFKLGKKGIEVTAVGTGKEAMEKLKEKKPDLVWLDILLPGMNGLEVLRRIREDPSLKDLAVIVVSVSSGPEKIKQAFALNAADYIVKSEYTIDEIVQKVEGFLERV